VLETEFHPSTRKAQKGSNQLLVALHGLGDSAAGYRFLPSALALPPMNYLLVNAPDSYYGGYAWYDFQGDADAGIRRSRRLLFEVLDEQPRRGFPTEQTYLFGFSQGCVMTVDVGFRYPARFAGLIGISGYVHEPGQLLKELSPAAPQQRMLFTHGSLDPLIPLPMAREQVGLLQQHGLAIEWVEFRKAHTIAGEEELGVIRRFIDGGAAENRDRGAALVS